ncbi:MAG: aminoacyl-histidine dipeptidase [Lachnospiraceae bacterium]|nr:aminoacyl-histidine dipeptidase [Lachnospiraceae bacterium]MDE6253131.1 aminoacyl-histidine dipeptidase [Lachnospiraceae bacterium]
MNVLNGLEPQAVFKYFEEISGIPHGSSDTKRISDYCVDFAKRHNLNYIQDSLNNVIIFKDGSVGYENVPPVIIQGHLDMVCEKESGVEIDFKSEGLKLALDNGVISADGTTLGGDDGIAVAYALAVLESDNIPHPPLEVVFTVDEEIGMLGAAGIDCTPLKSKRMLNIDSEEEGYLLVSCAGGVTAVCHMDCQRETREGIHADITVSGLLGGHSGVEIDKERANACKILGRILYGLKSKLSFDILNVNGGLKDNAIPREASASLLIDKKDINNIKDYVKDVGEILSNEYKNTDKDIRVEVKLNEEKTAKVMEGSLKDRIITALVNLPNGIQKMSSDIEGLVQTSLNLGILSTSEEEVSMSFSVRSSISTEKDELVSRLKCLMEALGGSVTCSGDYPAWEYMRDSELRELMVQIYEEQNGRKPIVQAIHAGVECGLFAGKISGLECVSFGPDIKDIHTPAERMDVESVKRTWEYLLEVLKRMK